MTALVLFNDAARANRLAAGLAGLGLHATASTSGLYGLTLLERNPVKLIVVGNTDDLPAQDLLEIVREDPQHQGLKVIYVGLPNGHLQRMADRSMSPETSTDSLLWAVREVMKIAPPSMAPVMDGSTRLSGTIKMGDALQLIHWVGSFGESGELRLRFLSGECRVYLLEGRPIHLTMADLQGPDAVRSLYLTTNSESGSFAFFPEPAAALASVPRTLKEPLENLLLRLVTLLDEEDRSSTER